MTRPVLARLRVSYLSYQHVPRPFGLGDPAIFCPGGNRVVAIVVLVYHSYRPRPVDALRSLQNTVSILRYMTGYLVNSSQHAPLEIYYASKIL
jgi:hypothetical protein